MSALKPRNFLRMLQSGFTTVKGFIATVRREERREEKRREERREKRRKRRGWTVIMFLLSYYILDFVVFYFITLCLYCILIF